MVNYANGKIYRIVCNITGLTYYGSTCEDTLAKRLTKHKAFYKQYLKGKKHSITSFEILKNENYEIVLVENYPCNSKDELCARERYYIENNICVNKIIPTRTKKEYWDLNKEKIIELNKKYYEKYYEKNQKELVEKAKQKYICECGSVFRISVKARHLKTQKHQRYLEQNNV